MSHRRNIQWTAFLALAIGALCTDTAWGGVAALLTAQEQDRRSRCSVERLDGEYLVTGDAERTAYQHDDPTYPRRVVAVWDFDGAGVVTGFTTQSQGGQIRDLIPVNGVYTLESNCTGLVEFPAAGARWRLVLLKNLREGAAIRIDEGHIAVRTLKRR